MRTIHKFGTGHPIPDDAIYRSTVVEEFWIETNGKLTPGPVPESAAEHGYDIERVRFVWHYYEVDHA